MTTPAAPATLVTTPSGNTLETAAPRTAVEIATTTARAEMAARAAATPAAPVAPVAPAAPAAPAVAGQARVPAGVTEGGQFAKPGEEGAPPAGPAAGTEATPEGGEQPPANETPEQKVAREEAERVAAAAAPDPLVVAMPGRHAGEEFEIKVDTPEAAERLAQLRNGFMRGEEIRIAGAQIMERAQQLTEREMAMQLDPTGFLDRAIGDEPELVDHVVLATLTRDDATWNRLKPIIQAMLSDPKELRTVRAEQKANRADIEKQMAEETRTAAVVRENLQDVQAAVATVLPASMPQAQQRILYEDCLRDLQGHANRYQMKTIPVHDIPTILAKRLTAYGINPVEAAAAIAASAARRSTAARPAAPSGPAPRTPAARPAAPLPNGQRFVASAVKKAAAGSIPAPGAGSPTTTGITPPVKADGTKMGIEEAIAFRRQQLAANRA